jgi:hypothetical protein
MAAQLSRFRVSAFPVVDDDGTVIGVVSETDMLTRHVLDLAREAPAGEHAGEEPQEPDDLTAGDLMTQPARKPPRWAATSYTRSGTCPAWWPYATASAIRWTRRRSYRTTGQSGVGPAACAA